MVKVAVRARSAPLEYPPMDARAQAKRKACIRAGNDLSSVAMDWLRGRTPDEQAAWLTGIVDVSRVLFQPWSLEILFVLGTFERCRFTELQRLLGVSSRTLSDKLQMLREEGFVERQVFDEQPVRIEYLLTKHGRATAVLAGPLVCELNRRHEERRAAP